MPFDYEQFGSLIRKEDRTRTAEFSPLPAAVMMLFVDRPEPHLLFIEKTKTQGYPWSGHVAFPGGRIQDHDPTPLDAAFREVQEELGIPRQELTVLGPLGSFLTRTSGISLHVFAARWSAQSRLCPDRKEIAEVFEIALDQLLHQHFALLERCPPTSMSPTSPPSTSATLAPSAERDLRYQVEGRTIWGVTARILNEVLATIKQCTPNRFHGTL